MAVRIFNNIASLNAQRHLGINNLRLAQSIERISSGLRINRAADDVAGLAISEKLRSDIRVLQQGLRNLNDGLSLVNVMEAALNEQTDMIIRMRELAAQAASATIGPTERGLLQLEVNALVAEINRFAAATEFNGQKLLDGSFTTLIVHFGVDASANSQLDIAAAAGFTTGVAVDMAFILSGTTTPFASAQTIDTGGVAVLGTEIALFGALGPLTANVNVDGTDFTLSVTTTASIDYDTLLIDINADLAVGGGLATASLVNGNIVITSGTTGSTSSITITDTDLFSSLGATVVGEDFVGLNVPIIGLDITTATAAQTAVASLDTATDAVITIRAGVAATQNRMVRIINTQATVIENLIAAESQIRDADIAAEIALLTRNQILVEAATAMVGQANLIPQSVLQLLG
ncbi:MAG: flagellin [Nitrospinae bacterium]|nr:flagellin [Nitrospinota bacterium]